MISRRGFIHKSSLAGLAAGLTNIPQWLIAENEDVFTFQSAFYKLALLKSRPRFSFFSTDSLGGMQFKTNPLLKEETGNVAGYQSSVNGNRITYFLDQDREQTPAWQFQCDPKQITITTGWSVRQQPNMPLDISFSQVANHCTVLGKLTGNQQLRFPCLLHFPGMGTFRLQCSDPSVTLFYDADRNVKDPFVKIVLPPADAAHPEIVYRFESVVIHPKTDKTKGDPRFDGFRRNFINIFQMNPRIAALANNSASDACAFTLFLYAEMAGFTPVLADGLTAMDLIRYTLDRYLGGMKAYGQVGYKGTAWNSKYDSSDSAPSLIISACDYILGTKDMEWADSNYRGIRDWAIGMMYTDHNRDGIIEYGYSGNSGSWNGSVRPANWWDTIGFGHADAYSNILAYQACRLISRVAALLGKQDDSLQFAAFADKLKGIYYDHFYNAQTGVLAGWRSADGNLHDYYFTFVNSMAVYYGLVEGERAKAIMQALLKKMKEVGYSDFRLGLPGNLVPVSKTDYTDFNKRFGYDSFQVYENGGATACYSYFTIKALYKLNMRGEANAMLFPMLESFKNGGFQGNCPGSAMTRDWKTWTGECWGYEGFLVDNYLVLLAVLDY